VATTRVRRCSAVAKQSIVAKHSAVALSGVALLLNAVQLTGCSGSQTTTGKRVSFETWATADQAELKSGFDTSAGWNVHLEQAFVAFDSFYYFDGEPAFVQNTLPVRPLRREIRPASPVDSLLGFLGEGVAHAHPGHYQAGNALGQMLVPGSIDLFATRSELGTGDGVTGRYRSARFTFAEKIVGSAADALGNHVAVVAGTATRLSARETQSDAGSADPLQVHFRLFADYADLAKNVTEGAIDGCEFKAANVQGNGSITLTFKPSIWFDLVDFSDVAPGSVDAPTEVPSGNIAQLGFAVGLVQLTAYHFSFSN
jgi:hypothetical protein